MKRKFTPPTPASNFARLLSSKVQISPSYAWELASGQKRPSLEKALEFERAYGIPASFWHERPA